MAVKGTLNGRVLADDDLLTPGEVARILHVDPKTVTRYANAGTLPAAVRLPGGHRRYRWADVRPFMVAEGGDDRGR